jgi:RNA polymerase sigma-70 factor (ECF subfamily)
MMDETQVTQHEDVSALLRGIREGDRQSFVRLVTLYQKKVYLLAYSYFKNREDAMEILQETFLRFYQKVDMFQEGRNFQSWLLQIAKNLCIDYDRKHYKRRREMESLKTVEELDLAAENEGREERSSDLKKIFGRCLEQLAERQRMIFTMRHYNGLKYQEIARILGISIGTVKSLHFKAVQNLRGLVGPYLGMER